MFLSPHKDDFVLGTLHPSSILMKELSGINIVARAGIICRQIFSSDGHVRVLTTEGFYIPIASACLLSLQAVYSVICGDGFQSDS